MTGNDSLISKTREAAHYKTANQLPRRVYCEGSRDLSHRAVKKNLMGALTSQKGLGQTPQTCYKTMTGLLSPLGILNDYVRPF